MKRLPKNQDLIKKIADAVTSGHLLYSNHANERLMERRIIKPEVEYVLLHGYHEVKKDHFNINMGSLDYSIRGRSVDGRTLRIVVAIVEPNVLVVTAIDLNQ